jgi:hypothetical protein
MSLPLLPSIPDLDGAVVSKTEAACFTAPCPYCAIQMNVNLDLTWDGELPNSGSNLSTWCCPFCGTPIMIAIGQRARDSLQLELVQQAPWCRFCVRPPKEHLGQPRPPSQPSLVPQPVVCLDLVEHLKEQGYLTPQQCSDIEGPAVDWRPLLGTCLSSMQCGDSD